MIKEAVNSAQMNRKYLSSLLPAGAVVLLKGASLIKRTKDTDYPFRQNSEFLYLTACNSPDLYLMITEKKDVLFIADSDIKKELWVGKVKNKRYYQEKYGFSEVAFSRDLEKYINREGAKKKKFLLLKDDKQFFRKKVCGYKSDSVTLLNIFRKMRPCKNNYEKKIMKKAASLSSIALNNTIEHIKPGLFEYQVAGIFYQELLQKGIRFNSFPSIVAAGKNASILHYEALSNRLNTRDLLLLDVGGEINGYASDITRTVPVSGKFTIKQREIYALVLKAQLAVIKESRIGMTLREIHDISLQVLSEGLRSLGIIKKISDSDAIKAVKVFYPHGVSHMLGIDTHDLSPAAEKNEGSNLRGSFTLQKDMVITVEPGLYFNKAFIEYNSKDKTLKNLINWHRALSYVSLGGIRIEDDLLITQNSSLLLTNTVKEIEDIEYLMRSQ